MPIYKITNSQITQFWDEEIVRPAGRNDSRNWTNENGKNLWTPPIDLVSKIIAYDELQEARASSRKAMWITTASLITAIIVGIAQIFLSLKN